MFTIDKEQIINETERFVENIMKKYDESHDYNHVIRVKNIATEIALTENMNFDDIFEVQLGALTHDINDHKYSNDIEAQEKILREFFNNKIDKNIIDSVVNIACNVSLSKEISQKEKGIVINCKKLHCVQDADRIESLGAVGITRYFLYGSRGENKKSMKDIVKNMEERTSKLMSLIKTKKGMEIAVSKYNIMKIFIDDYKKRENYM